MLKKEELMDATFMCVELFLAVLKYSGFDLEKAKGRFNIAQVIPAEYTKRKKMPEGLTCLNAIYKNNGQAGSIFAYYASEGGREYVLTNKLYGLLLGVYRYIIGFERDYWQYHEFSDKETAYKMLAKQFWDFLDLIN